MQRSGDPRGSYDNDAENDGGENAGRYTLFDLGVSYNVNPFEFRAFVQNVTDELAFITRDLTETAQVLPPRTFGVSVRAEF